MFPGLLDKYLDLKLIGHQVGYDMKCFLKPNIEAHTYNPSTWRLNLEAHQMEASLGFAMRPYLSQMDKLRNLTHSLQSSGSIILHFHQDVLGSRHSDVFAYTWC